MAEKKQVKDSVKATKPKLTNRSAGTKATKSSVGVASESTNSRVRKLTYKDKKKSVKVNEPIPSAFRLLRLSLGHLWRVKVQFAGIMVIYGLLYMLLVKGFATGFNLSEVKQTVMDTGESTDGATLGLALVVSMFSSIGAVSSESAGLYQMFLIIFISLVIIWSLRRTYDGVSKITVKQAFYSSSYPLVQYILVVIILCLQLLPALAGLLVYSLVSSNGLAVGNIENVFWLVFLLIFCSWSIFLISSSLFATYIVTLSDMTPLKSLRTAKRLVKFRRFAVIRKLLFLPLFLFVFALVSFLPLALYVPVIAEVLFVIFSILMVLIGHSYVYHLYKKLTESGKNFVGQ
ncbi:hypothetical protein KC867_03150 [Candidatus Saccharibacteria bacterium]|nr:hypothetical protein [Candidatus Saccharibacteria bacterium]